MAQKSEKIESTSNKVKKKKSDDNKNKHNNGYNDRKQPKQNPPQVPSFCGQRGYVTLLQPTVSDCKLLLRDDFFFIFVFYTDTTWRITPAKRHKNPPARTAPLRRRGRWDRGWRKWRWGHHKTQRAHGNRRSLLWTARANIRYLHIYKDINTRMCWIYTHTAVTQGI